MSKYRTEAGIECTEEECKLIDSFKRIAKNGRKMENDCGYIQQAEHYM